LAPLEPVAQKVKPKRQKKERVPPLIIQVAEIQKQNVELPPIPKRHSISVYHVRHKQIKNLFSLVIHQNPTIWGNLFEHRSAWEKLLAMMTGQGKYRTLHPTNTIRPALGIAITSETPSFTPILRSISLSSVANG